MKLFFTSILLFLLTFQINAQQGCNQYFPFEHFRLMTFGSYDAKDRYESSQTWEVRELKEENGEKIAIVHLIIREADGRRMVDTEFTARCANETYFISMEAFHLNDLSASMTDGIDIDIRGDDLSLPNELREGMTLPDARMEVAIRGLIPINVDMHVHNRKVDSRTTVSVPVGQLQTWKISYDTTVRAGLSVRGSTIDYVAEKYGTVRTENFNRRGRLQSYSVLEEALSW